MTTEVQHMKLIQVMVTNRCENKCSHCSQMIPLRNEKWDMDLDFFRKVLKTLQDYPGHIGIMGGNPLLHPDFAELMLIYKKFVPVKARRELWCSKAKYDLYKDIIDDVFYPELVAYNEHEEQQPCWHQPTNIAIDEVFGTHKARMWDLITNCWVQNRWSAMVTPHGAYFCEVAAARAEVLAQSECPRIPGVPVMPGWWKLKINEQWEYVEQRRQLCTKCSMCLPMPVRPNDSQCYDSVSNMMYHRLVTLGVKWPLELFDIGKLKQWYEDNKFVFNPETDYEKRGGYKDIPDWTPWIYRPFTEKKHSPEDVKEKQDEKDKV